jgi:hypothetical protein
MSPLLFLILLSFGGNEWMCWTWMDANDRLGFAHLNPQFGIRFGGPDKTRLPSACKLPSRFVSGLS